MEKKSTYSFRRGRKIRAEEIHARLDLHGKDRERFKANPSRFLKRALQQHGFRVNRVVVVGRPKASGRKNYIHVTSGHYTSWYF